MTIPSDVRPRGSRRKEFVMPKWLKIFLKIVTVIPMIIDTIKQAIKDEK